MYRSCGFYTYDDQGKMNELVQIGSYSLEQFKRCLDCKHFATACEDYSCRKDGGLECLMERADMFESKAPSFPAR